MKPCFRHSRFDARCKGCIARSALSQAHYRELNTARLVLLGHDMRIRAARRNELVAVRRERERYKELLGSLKRIKPGPRTYYSKHETSLFGSQLGLQR